MNILMVTAEAAPLAKTGGLADAVWALGVSLSERGHEVALLMPKYPWIEVETTPIISGRIECFEPAEYRILHGRFEGIGLYLVESAPLSSRNSIYGESGEYPDNALRFSILGHAAAELCRRDDSIDVVQGHDWPSGIALSLCRKLSASRGKASPRTVVTIHNGAYTGAFAKHDIHYTSLSPLDFARDIRTFRRSPHISFLHAGIIAADAVTTVSPAYAREITTVHDAPGDGGMAGTGLPIDGDSVYGIINGADYSVWDPATDRYIPATYSESDLSGKKRCAQALRDRFGLPPGNAPIIGMIARLVDQKGFEELCFPDGGAIARIVNLDTRLVILGTGDPRYEEALREAARRYVNIGVHIGFDESLAHLIEAGSDLFLMPSRYEPCGLNQLYSLRYGTPPIVHATGGLADTVIDVHEHPHTGNGYRYYRQTAREITAAVSRAVDVFRLQPTVHERIMRRGMAEDHSWGRTAIRYEELFESIARDGRE